MAYWTVIGKGNSGSVEGRAFGLTLDTDNYSWIANGPSVDLFFKSKSGKYKVITDATFGQGTQLLNVEEKVAGFLEALTRASAVGDTGNGHALEKGETFRWTLDSK